MANIDTIDLNGSKYAVVDSTARHETPWYATSSTAASTTAKVATTTQSGFTLTTGCKVIVKFTYTNTASAPTLNINSTGAKTIYGYGTTKPSLWWLAGDVVEFTYDGTNWIMQPTQGQVATLNSSFNVETITLSEHNHFTESTPFILYKQNKIISMVVTGTTDKELVAGTEYALSSMDSSYAPLGTSNIQAVTQSGARVRFYFGSNQISIIPIDTIPISTFIQISFTYISRE